MRRTVCCLVIAALASQLTGCGFVVVHTAKKAYRELTKDERDIEYALNRYRFLTTQGEFDKAAEMFDQGAELSKDGQAPVIGREAIRASFKSAAGLKVVDFELTATSTSASGAKGTQQGTYHQRVKSPEGEIVDADGSFEAEWSQQVGGAWLLHRMHTSAKLANGG